MYIILYSYYLSSPNMYRTWFVINLWEVYNQWRSLLLMERLSPCKQPLREFGVYNSFHVTFPENVQ